MAKHRSERDVCLYCFGTLNEDRVCLTCGRKEDDKPALPNQLGRRTMLNKPASDLGRAAASLDALSPLKVLARGYSIAYSDDGVATSAKTFKPGDAIRVRMADGNVAATVDTVE